MKSGSMTVKEINGILSRIKDDDELRKELARLLKKELVGSKNPRVRLIKDVGRLRR